MDNEEKDDSEKQKRKQGCGCGKWCEWICGCEKAEIEGIKAIISIPILYTAIAFINVGLGIINLFNTDDELENEESNESNN